ncbi:MAG: lipopolysaccharide transport periplasmic protein LptA [Nitrospirae bacterium]|nr:lipopolysaccharide transport periplasmic protein LptA [Nitrospirota bacterium]
MSRALFTVNLFFAVLLFPLSISAASASHASKESPIFITSDTLIADSKNNTAVFEGSVVAASEDISIASDKMTVFYDAGGKKIAKIFVLGNVRVQKGEMTIFSNEAEYIDDEEKIIFTGNPKVIEKGNSIAGTKIIYFLKDEKAMVEGSRVLIKNKPD